MLKKNNYRKRGLTKRSKFADVSNEWISHKKETLKTSSIESYKRILEHFILPIMGEMTFIQANKSEDKLIQRLEENTLLSDNYCKDIIILYRCIISWFLEEEHRAEAIRKQKTEVQYFAPEELNIISNSCKANLEIEIMIFTGMSVGEIAALRWEDFEKGFINVSRNAQRVSNSCIDEINQTRIIETAITKRRIPIAPQLQRILEEIPKSQKKGRVASTNEPRTIQYQFTAVMKDVRYTGSPQKIRDSFAINSIRKGTNPIFIAYVMGMTLDSFEKRFRDFICETITDDNLLSVVE